MPITADTTAMPIMAPTSAASRPIRGPPGAKSPWSKTC